MAPSVLDNIERWMLIALYDFPEARKSVRNCKTLIKSDDKGFESVGIQKWVQFRHAES